MEYGHAYIKGSSLQYLTSVSLFSSNKKCWFKSKTSKLKKAIISEYSAFQQNITAENNPEAYHCEKCNLTVIQGQKSHNPAPLSAFTRRAAGKIV